MLKKTLKVYADKIPVSHLDTIPNDEIKIK